MSTVRVLVTGSRDWTDVSVVRSALQWVIASFPGHSYVLIHGDARGLDKIAGEEARALGWGVEVYPADWKRLGRRAGPIRNGEMVALGATLCLSFPVKGAKGTWDCSKQAKDADIPVHTFNANPTYRLF